MKHINIAVIPHREQRYDTVGDYWTDVEPNGIEVEQFRISDMGVWQYEALVAVHEFVERILCKAARITNESIDKFDKKFEEDRENGHHGDEEPGDDPDAPYYKQHQFASIVERMLCHELGIDWHTYEQAVLKVGE